MLFWGLGVPAPSGDWKIILKQSEAQFENRRQRTHVVPLKSVSGCNTGQSIQSAIVLLREIYRLRTVGVFVTQNGQLTWQSQ